MVSRPFSGRLMDAKGANIVMYPCLFIFAIAMLLFSQANLGLTLLLAGALFGLGFGNLQSISQAIAIQVAPPHKLGLATATYYMFYDMKFKGETAWKFRSNRMYGFLTDEGCVGCNDTCNPQKTELSITFSF